MTEPHCKHGFTEDTGVRLLVFIANFVETQQQYFVFMNKTVFTSTT
jgi:hypothetical protein